MKREFTLFESLSENKDVVWDGDENKTTEGRR